MRIVYIHQYFKTLDEAGGTRSYEWARRLAAAGHEVHMVTGGRARHPKRRRLEVEACDGFTVHTVPVDYSNGMGHARRAAAFVAFALRSTVRAVSLRPQVVVATSTPLTVAVPGMIASAVNRARFVFEVRDLWPELPIEVGALRNPVLRALATALAVLTYRRADHVVTLSPGMADGVRAHGVPAERTSIVPNACDVDLFAPDAVSGDDFRAERAWLADRPLVVYAGTVGRLNGVDYLVRLAAQVQRFDPDVRFLVVGAGACRDDVVALAEQLGVLGRNMYFSAPVPKAQMPHVLAAATVATSLFLPVRGMEANSANKFFDALAAGRPVAVNYGGWHADLIESTGAGLRLDAVDHCAAAARLVALLRDERRTGAAGAASRRLAQRFSRDALFPAFERAVLGGAPDDLASQAPDQPRHRAPAVVDLGDGERTWS